MRLLLTLAANFVFASALRLATPGPASQQFSCAHDYVLVYSRAKTGTSSIQASLQDLCGYETFPYLQRIEESYPRAIKVHGKEEVVADFLAKVPENSTVWILTAVRNPFERIMSFYFQSDWCRYVNDDGTTAGDEEATMSTAIDDLHRSIASHGYENEWPAWQNSTGVDILSETFDATQKHISLQTFHNSRTLNTLLLRMEDIGDWESILGRYIPGFKLLPSNEADDKTYADFYAAFANRFIFNEAEVDEIMKNSPELKFYPQRDISHMVSGATLTSATSFRLQDGDLEDMRSAAKRSTCGCNCHGHPPTQH